MSGELLRRYSVFLSAMIIGSCGVSMVTQSLLGVNSVACFSYVASVYFPLTMGTVNIMFNLTMYICQFFILTTPRRKAEFKNLLLQIPAMIVFGLMLDVWRYLMADLDVSNYAVAFFWLIFGSCLVSLNVSLQVTASVAMLPCDGFVRYLAERMQKKLGRVKLSFDLILVGSAALMSLFCSGFTEIVGIREGTVIGAIIVGPVAGFFLKPLQFLGNWCKG